jgi:hypothetical protein
MRAVRRASRLGTRGWRAELYDVALIGLLVGGSLVGARGRRPELYDQALIGLMAKSFTALPFRGGGENRSNDYWRVGLVHAWRLRAIGLAAGDFVAELGPADGDVEGLALTGFYFAAVIGGNAGQEQKGQGRARIGGWFRPAGAGAGAGD